MKKVYTRYFLSAITSKGYRSFFSQLEEQGIDIFKSMLLPDDVIEELIKKVKIRTSEEGLGMEIVINPLTNKESGIIVPKLRSGFINLSIFEKEQYDKPINYNGKLMNDIKENFNNAYTYFAKALKIHNDWEKIYISNTDFQKIDKLKDSLINLILADKALDKKGIRKDRFLGASTSEGPVDYIEELTFDNEKRYFIKGRPGTGKSTFMKGIAEKALEKGFDVDIYHCAFDPDSIDMIIINELSVSIFDSTSPHEHFPSKNSDEIIDIYKIAVKNFTDEIYKDKLKLISENYEFNISKAVEALKKARNIIDDNKHLIRKISEKKVNLIEYDIWYNIFK